MNAIPLAIKISCKSTINSSCILFIDIFLAAFNNIIKFFYYRKLVWKWINLVNKTCTSFSLPYLAPESTILSVDFQYMCVSTLLYMPRSVVSQLCPLRRLVFLNSKPREAVQGLQGDCVEVPVPPCHPRDVIALKISLLYFPPSRIHPTVSAVMGRATGKEGLKILANYFVNQGFLLHIINEAN